MVKSMTAYSRTVSREVDGHSWVVEIHSVNRKFLDIHLHLTRELLFLDTELRKMFSKTFHRGHLTVRIYYNKGKQITPNIQILKRLKEEWEKTASALDFSEGEIDLSFLLVQMDKVSLEDFDPEVIHELKNTVHKGIEDALKMKKEEGKSLAEDISKRLQILENTVNEVEQCSKNIPDQYRTKLIERLEGILQEVTSDERILREVALFAEKIDITEEITRLKSHLKQAKNLLNEEEKSIGRTFDFLIQEMLREFNTISAKSNALEIIKKTLVSKAELEKIREQVQNIE